MKSYISKLRSDWKYFLQSDQGINSKLTTHTYICNFLYPQNKGIVPKSRIKELLNRFYKERIQFIPKDKRPKFDEYFKEAFKTELSW